MDLGSLLFWLDSRLLLALQILSTASSLRLNYNPLGVLTLKNSLLFVFFTNAFNQMSLAAWFWLLSSEVICPIKRAIQFKSYFRWFLCQTNMYLIVKCKYVLLVKGTFLFSQCRWNINSKASRWYKLVILTGLLIFLSSIFVAIMLNLTNFILHLIYHTLALRRALFFKSIIHLRDNSMTNIVHVTIA